MGSALLVSTRWAMPEPLRVRRVTVQVLTLFLYHKFKTNAESGELIGENNIMSTIKVKCTDFDSYDGNGFAVAKLVDCLVALLNNGYSVYFEDIEKKCSNEKELRTLLEKLEECRLSNKVRLLEELKKMDFLILN